MVAVQISNQIPNTTNTQAIKPRSSDRLFRHPPLSIHEEKTEKIRRPMIFIVKDNITEDLRDRVKKETKNENEKNDADWQYVKRLERKFKMEERKTAIQL